MDMDALKHTESEKMKTKKRNHMRQRHYTNTLSFSASLPDDVQGPYAESICAVKYSMDPFVDLRESIVDMIKNVGVESWEEMEELIYCYVVLNSSDIHGFIVEAFLSLCSSSSLL